MKDGKVEKRVKRQNSRKRKEGDKHASTFSNEYIL